MDSDSTSDMDMDMDMDFELDFGIDLLLLVVVVIVVIVVVVSGGPVEKSVVAAAARKGSFSFSFSFPLTRSIFSMLVLLVLPVSLVRREEIVIMVLVGWSVSRSVGRNCPMHAPKKTKWPKTAKRLLPKRP